jgi:hypothetical protein
MLIIRDETSVEERHVMHQIEPTNNVEVLVIKGPALVNTVELIIISIFRSAEFPMNRVVLRPFAFKTSSIGGGLGTIEVIGGGSRNTPFRINSSVEDMVFITNQTSISFVIEPGTIQMGNVLDIKTGMISDSGGVTSNLRHIGFALHTLVIGCVLNRLTCWEERIVSCRSSRNVLT